MKKQMNEMQLVAVWCSDSVLVSTNEINLRWAQLLLGWVTVSEFNSQCMWSILKMGRMSVYDIRPKPKVWASSPNECRSSADL